MMVAIHKFNPESTTFPCWKEVVDINGVRQTPIVYCKCGKRIGINHYTIDKDGVVSPSFWHQKKHNWELLAGEENGCDFHEHIKLEGF